MKSGWCSAPAGARPHCGECVSLICSCACHADQTCAACLAPVLSDTHHAECVAPLDQLGCESLSTAGESPLGEPGDDGAGWYDKRRAPAAFLQVRDQGSDHLPALPERG